MSGCTAANCSVGFAIGRHSPGLGAGFHWTDVPRYDVNKDVSLKKAAEEYARIRELVDG
jgi:hypothetical protein